MATYRMTPARKAALKRAQAASARKRRKGGSKSKASSKKKKGQSKIWGWSPRAVATRMAIGGAAGFAYGSYIDSQRRRGRMR